MVGNLALDEPLKYNNIKDSFREEVFSKKPVRKQLPQFSLINLQLKEACGHVSL